MNWDLLSLLKQLVSTDKIDVSSEYLDMGFDSAKNQSSEKRIIYQLINQIIKKSKNPSIGLSVGKLINPNSFHGLGYLFMSANNLKEACSRIAEFPYFFHKIVSIHTEDCGEYFEFSVDNEAQQPHVKAIINEATLGIIYQYTKWLSHREIGIYEIQLENPPLSERSTYIKHFDQYPSFESAKNCILFDRQEALSPLISSQPEYHAALYSKLQEKHESMSQTFVARVKKAIRDRVKRGTYSRQTVANDLNLSEKTFERRLSECNFSYRELVDIIRLEIAQRYLSEPGYSIDEIARMLGYSDRGTFSKAFKKWTGVTPREKVTLVKSRMKEM